MANISMDMIKELRERTGVGIMDCKKALAETDGDMDKAIRLLKERGAITAAKKSDRNAKEGIISAVINDNKNHVTCIELQCETDFVAKNEEFQNLAKDITSIASGVENANVENVLNALSSNGEKVSDVINQAIQKMGENTVLSKVYNLKTDGFFGFYEHTSLKNL